MSQKQFADDRRVIKDFTRFDDAHKTTYVANQILKQVFEENGLKEESELMEKVMRMLGHQFHKSKYPEHYNGDKADEEGYRRDYETELESKWFKGDVFSGEFSSRKLEQYKEKYEKNIKKPTALRTKVMNGKTYSQFYYKPITPGELD